MSQSTPTADTLPPVFQTTEVVYAKKVDNIRSGPGTNYPVLRKTSPGEPLVYSENQGGWYKLTGVNKAQWIHESAVRTADEKRARASADLAVPSWHWSQEYGYAIAEGQVTNLTGASLKHVMAVVTFETSDGTFITSDDAVIDYDPLLPGQTSPWKVMARWNPAMKKASVEFKMMFGRNLSSYSD